MSDIDKIFGKAAVWPWLRQRTLFLTKHGSQAYGTSLPTSDVDYKGFAAPPPDYYYGFNKKFDQAESKKDPDCTIYNIQKFFRLAATCNPSIVEVMWTDASEHVLLTKLGEKVLAKRELFLSKKAKASFSGYAVAQLKRIKTHKKYIDHPPSHKPTREEFELPQKTTIPKDQLGAAITIIKKDVKAWNADLGALFDQMDEPTRIEYISRQTETLAELKILSDSDMEFLAAKRLGLTSDFLHILEKERAYKSKMDEWDSYQEWLANRNEARSELERKFGYDTKHGNHLIRLMRMAREILETGKVIVKRPDKDELLAVRAGSWKYDTLIEWAEKEDAYLKATVKNSILPDEPDGDALHTLLVEVVEAARSI